MEQKFKLIVDDNTFVGDKATLARTYCLKRNIKLGVLPDPFKDNIPTIAACIARDCFFHIAPAPLREEDFFDFETGYRIFFDYMLAKQGDRDYEIKEIKSA